MIANEIVWPAKFAIDGRTMVSPDKGHGLKMRAWTARRIVTRFLMNGESFHGSKFGVSWAIIEYCALQGIKIEVIDHELGGRRIVRIAEKRK